MVGGFPKVKKNSKKDSINLFFSAFLVTAYVVCSFFFSQLASSMSSVAGSIVEVLIYSVFGLILFYATRVGDGKQVLRFSPMTLIVLVLPALYIILAFLIPEMPFGAQIAENSLIMTIAAVAFGYGLPYTFISGYEIEMGEAEDSEEEEDGNNNPFALKLSSNEKDKEESKNESTEETEETEEIEEIDEEALSKEMEKIDFEFEEQDYFPEEEEQTLAEQDMLDAENNAEEAALLYGDDEDLGSASDDDESKKKD